MLPLRRVVQTSDKARESLLVVVDGVILTRHAIDRAFERCHHCFEETKLANEGALSWLARQVIEALAKGEKDDHGVFIHNGLGLAIEIENSLPRLKTVYAAGCYRSTDSPVASLREKLISVAADCGRRGK